MICFMPAARSLRLTIARPSVLSASTRSVSIDSLEQLLVGRQADALVDVVLERGQTARIDRVDRRVVAVGRVEHLAQAAGQIGLIEEVRATRARGIRGRSPRPAECRAGLFMPGYAADGSFSCAGTELVKPSLTRMIDLRPSRMPPSRDGRAL